MRAFFWVGLSIRKRPLLYGPPRFALPRRLLSQKRGVLGERPLLRELQLGKQPAIATRLETSGPQYYRPGGTGRFLRDGGPIIGHNKDRSPLLIISTEPYRAGTGSIALFAHMQDCTCAITLVCISLICICTLHMCISLICILHIAHVHITHMHELFKRSLDTGY